MEFSPIGIVFGAIGGVMSFIMARRMEAGIVMQLIIAVLSAVAGFVIATKLAEG